ncbi:hypothetical protein [Kribbella sp. CA-293567]|uniref:hypothetical protein n=1 Tax=Kribbella sp. CA-293567 TaxID=3002436 RepID=UPI0022DE887D|nr:hypothetical protein [Kribbella sp. CA-293567]WBQ02732.1 hypothetical protein OX958_22420 [Kribbella sp. CA-293567]
MSGRLRTTGRAATAALLVAGLTPGAAVAAPTSSAASTAACQLQSGSVTAGGDHTARVITAGSPPTVLEKRRYTDIFPDGQVRLSGLVAHDPVVDQFGGGYHGHVVMGAGLYRSFYLLTEAGEVDRSQALNDRIGGGWGEVTFLDSSYPKNPDPFALAHHYSLRADGTITRWDQRGSGWLNPRTASGFSAVKTMALISQTATYDTFLANTRGGALYTIRLPKTSPLKPVVKKLRGTTWQGFDALIAERCGQYGTLLLGIDKDTKSGYLYAVGHANGTATVIQGLGKVPAIFADAVNFRYTKEPGEAPLLFGE